jgi:hypothetical protein
MAKLKAKGVTLKYGSSATPTDIIPQAVEISLDLGAWDRNDITDLAATTNKEMDATLREPITCEVQGLLDPKDTHHGALITLHGSGASNYFRLEFNTATPKSRVDFQAQVVNLSVGGITPTGHVTFSMTLGGIGSYTFAASPA